MKLKNAELRTDFLRNIRTFSGKTNTNTRALVIDTRLIPGRAREERKREKERKKNRDMGSLDGICPTFGFLILHCIDDNFVKHTYGRRKLRAWKSNIYRSIKLIIARQITADNNNILQ